jgi:hypothetical protein
MSISRTRHLAGLRVFAAVALTSLAAIFGVQSLSPAQAQTAAQAPTTAAAATQTTILDCPPKYLCLYKKPFWNNYGGHPETVLTDCHPPYNLKNWIHHGSYINNQVGGVTSKFFSGKDGTGKLLRTSKSYPSGGGDINGWYRTKFNFYPVNSIDVC